jgi:PAS domain S-box-containing protein
MDNTKAAKSPGQMLKEGNSFTQNLYEKMMEEVQDYAIILLDEKGTIIDWNLGAEKIKGYTPGEVLGKNFSVFYLPEDREDHLPERLIGEARASGRASHEGWRQRKDGTRFWGSVTITALHDENNAITGFLKVTRDLSERKLAEDQIKQHAMDLEARNRELEQFVYIASHDLQEPMRKIQTFVQMIDRNSGDPAAANKYLDKINAAAKRMSALINAILNYSRLTNYEENYVAVDLNQVLEQVKTDYDLLLREKAAIVESDRLPVVHGLPLQLNQLFSNLMSNSLKFSGIPTRIRISCRLVPSEEMGTETGSLPRSFFHEVKFEDNGIGFDQVYADQIFTMFRRLHSHYEYPGTGIGLALCKKIVENHHGFIFASGRAGRGASFTIYLPASK